MIKLGVEADEVAAEAMIQAVRGNAHEEKIELWANKIREVMADGGKMLLMELQQKSGLNLVDLSLGLLLGDTGCSIRRQWDCEIDFNVDFYDRTGIWIVELLKEEKDRKAYEISD